MSEDEKDVTEKVNESSAMDRGSGDSVKNNFPLGQETVWLKQHQYEEAEIVYHMKLAAGLLSKPVQAQNETEASPDPKPGSDLLDKKLQAEGSALLKTAKTIWGRLEEIEKVQNRRTETIKDIASKLATAIEEYRTRLSGELVQSSAQLNLFRSLLTEVEAVVDRTSYNLRRKKWGSFKTHEGYCEAVTNSLSKLVVDLNTCFSLYSSFQADVPKLDIHRIIGEISKISVGTRNEKSDKFIQKKGLISNEIKLLMDGTTGANEGDSDTSLEGSCSIYSDDSENDGSDVEAKTNKRQQSGVSKSKKVHQENKQTGNTSNRNNANNVIAGNRIEKVKPKADTTRTPFGQSVSAMPVKRTAQGTQSIAHKKPDLFQFRGVSNPTRVPFLNQPGLLGPRPNTHLPIQGTNQQVPFRFSNFNTLGQQHIPSHPNSGAIHNMNPLSSLGQPRFGGMNFNFSSSQPRPSSFEFGRSGIAQNSLLASMGVHPSSPQGNHPAGNISNQVKQSKLLQLQQSQNKITKGSDKLFGAKSSVFYPLQQNPRASLFMPNSQAGVLGSHPLSGHESLEQQLNEMTQKIQQMQLATSQNLHLQHLMRETERLKQMVAQKQHQQQDQFKHQFQLLINAFMQQQQQQQMQGPQSKMARSVQFYNSQKQQQRNIHIRQQLNKKQKQQTKVQQVKQESNIEDGLLKTKQAGLSGESALLNGEETMTGAPKGRKIIGENSKVTRIGTFSPHAHGDKHRAGVSSIVVMEDIGCVVVVDIINSCLKLYNVTVTGTSPMELSHHQVTRLELSRPYYMSKLSRDMIIVSREGKILSLVKVSKNRLECLHDLKTESQYYGLGYVKDNVIVCAAFVDNKIDLLNIQDDGITQSVTLLTQCNGPELVAAVPSTGCILYLERVINETVHLLGISQKGSIDFTIDLESSPADVWSVASISDRIICCSKESGKVKLFNTKGQFLTDVNFPAGSVNQPFAMAFCDSGNMYIANDGAWDNEYQHYVTTDINTYAFS